MGRYPVLGWPLSRDESHCCSHPEHAMITALELRTGGTAAPALPALRRAPPAPGAPNQSPSSPGPMAAPARGTRRTRAEGGGCTSPYTLSHHHRPPVPVRKAWPRRRPEAAGRARKAVAAGRRCRVCHVGAVRGRVSAGDAEVRVGTAKSSVSLLFSSGSCRKRGEGGGPAGRAGCPEAGEPWG